MVVHKRSASSRRPCWWWSSPVFTACRSDLRIDVGFTSHAQAYGSAYSGGGFALGLGLNALQCASVGYGETKGGLSADISYIGFASFGYGAAGGGTVQMSLDEADADVSVQQRIRGGAGGGLARCSSRRPRRNHRATTVRWSDGTRILLRRCSDRVLRQIAFVAENTRRAEGQ